MTDQVILNLSLAQLARLGEAKEFKSNMLKKQYLIKKETNHYIRNTKKEKRKKH